MIQSAMIFAAGFGTRMAGLTRDRPKPLIPVAGIPLIDHAVDRVREAGVQRIVVNTHYLGDQIADHLCGQSISLSHEYPDILDTGGGLRAALPLLEADPVFTLNPDVLWLGPNPLTLLQTAWRPQTMDGLLLCTPLERTHGRVGGGDFSTDDQGCILRGGDLVYGGAQIIRTDRLHEIPEEVFSLNRLWNLLAADGRLHAAIYPGEWCDIGRPENIALAEDLLARSRV